MRFRTKKGGYIKMDSPPTSPKLKPSSPPPTADTTNTTLTSASTTLMSTGSSDLTSFTTSTSTSKFGLTLTTHTSPPPSSSTDKPLPAHPNPNLNFTRSNLTYIDEPMIPTTPKPDPNPTPTPYVHLTLTQSLTSLRVSASLAVKLLTYIPSPSSSAKSILTLGLSRKKDRELFLRKEELVVALAEFGKGEDGEEEGWDGGEFGEMISPAGGDGKGAGAGTGGDGGGGTEEWSKEYMMECARCEGRKEGVEYACTKLITSSETRLRENIVKPLSHALNTKTVPLYTNLIFEAKDILSATNGAISYWTYKLREEVKLADQRLAAVPTGGVKWDEDYAAFATVKKEAREEFAKGLCV